MQIWYYLSILGLAWASLVYTSSATCIGQVNARCGDISETSIVFIVLIATTNFYTAYRMYKYSHLFKPIPSLQFSWQGDRTFPLSFIVFFTFSAVFLGEHLPVIIGFLSNHYNAVDSKPSIFDLGGLSDVGVVYVIYIVFGTILWGLFRFFSWPIILLIGALLGGVGEVYLFLNEQNPAEDTVNLQFVISIILIWGGLISVIPQIIYQKIARLWGSRGLIMAITIVVVLNLASISYFAYQKFVLKHVNYSKTGLPIGVCPDRLVEEVGKSTVAFWQGITFNRINPGVYEWVTANCPGVVERHESL